MRCLPVSFFLVSASLAAVGCSTQPKIQIVEDKCGKCHTAERVYESKRTPAEWERVVYGMKVRGLVLSDAEEKMLMTELNTKLGKK